MATVQDRKAPSAGTKVDPGRNAPVTREGAGLEAPDSLAAESRRDDGEFAANRRSEPEDTRSGHQPTKPSQAEQASRSNVSGREAETKISKAGGFDDPRLKDGLSKALNSEPGSIDDPSRLAEVQMKQAEAARPSVTGPNQGKLDTGTAYDNLDSEVPS
ncbi:hypothetical protein XA68_11974 [Ophiocordyceps unilateralis]|uniref:Uncharacterized protein n=1 Tax=Ophiocordyceps unilateralis TaxID=268505 RepID=A0A2A9PFB9_OPHUN|nr:hypothetical protein XA68_11974 [Ophiocordyceps unilateralis]